MNSIEELNKGINALQNIVDLIENTSCDDVSCKDCPFDTGMYMSVICNFITRSDAHE